MHETSTPQRILIVRPSALGDVCRTVPVLASLRAAWPEASIDWVVQDDFVDAVSAHPALTEAIGFPRRAFSDWWKPHRAAAVRRWLGDLRRREYDLVVDCQGLSRSGLMTRATRARRRVGSRDARELGWLGYTDRVRHADGCHAVDRMLDLVRAAGATPLDDMRLYARDDDAAWWAERRIEAGALGTHAVLAPTARWASKRWPIERWVELVQPLVGRGYERLLVVGGPSERDQVAPLLDVGGPVVDLVGQTTIGQSLAVIAETDLVIANDSAPLHIAVGFDRPLVGLFGPTDPSLVGPYKRDDAVVRADEASTRGANYRERGIGDDLMRLIETTEVLETVDRVRAGAAESTPC